MPGGAGDQQRMQQLSMLGAFWRSGHAERSQVYQQQSVLQNTMRHQQTLEDLERQKVNQSNFEVIKDMYGNATGAIDKRTGRLPLAVREQRAGRAGRIDSAGEGHARAAGAHSGQLPSFPGRLARPCQWT
jgi:hypothetical protein